jgi:hypothetical protein
MSIFKESDFLIQVYKNYKEQTMIFKISRFLIFLFVGVAMNTAFACSDTASLNWGQYAGPITLCSNGVLKINLPDSLSAAKMGFNILWPATTQDGEIDLMPGTSVQIVQGSQTYAYPAHSFNVKISTSTTKVPGNRYPYSINIYNDSANEVTIAH